MVSGKQRVYNETRVLLALTLIAFSAIEALLGFQSLYLNRKPTGGQNPNVYGASKPSGIARHLILQHLLEPITSPQCLNWYGNYSFWLMRRVGYRWLAGHAVWPSAGNIVQVYPIRYCLQGLETPSDMEGAKKFLTNLDAYGEAFVSAFTKAWRYYRQSFLLGQIAHR